MAVTVVFNGREIVLPGSYGVIKAIATPTSTPSQMGLGCLIDTGSGLYDFGGVGVN